MEKRYLITLIVVLTIFLIFFNLLAIRLLNQREIDDITPEIPCSQKYIQKSQILWVIPKFNNQSIDENPEGCNEIKSLNKTLGLHGVYHTYEEFQTDRSQKYLEEGITSFKDCFGFSPKLFKPPQLKISNNNRQLIKNNNLKTKTKINQLTHKVYHCSDTGVFSNKFIDFF